MVSQEDEAIERRAREKLLARRNDHAIERRAREKLLARKARAAAARANGNGLTTNSIKLVMEEGFNGGARTKLDESFIHNEQQEQQEEEETVITPEPVSEPGSAYSRPKDRNSRSERRKRAKQRKKMSGRGEMAPRDRGPPPPRGRHHYRDEFGRQPPPPHWGDAGGYNRGPPSYRDGGIPPGRWERDRGMARGRHRDDRHYNSNSNSNNNRNRDRHNHRSRRDRSYSSSPSRSRSLSSRGSSSSFSSSNSERSEASSYHSDDSRSLSRSRSRSSSRSRSPSAQSPVPKNIKKEEEKTDSKIDEQKNKKDSADKLLQEKVKKEDSNGTPSSKDSKRSTHSRSRSRSVSEDSRERRRGRDRKRKSSRKSHRSRSRSVSRSHSPASYSDASSHYSRRRKERKSKRRRRKKGLEKEDAYSKDQRTIFVSQLVMRTTEKDLKKYFKRKVGCKVNDVILLRDRRNSRNHKGCAYVEVGRIQDVATAVAVSGQPPDFQRFPILIKASEAEKNYSTTLGATVTTKMDGSMNSAIAVTPNTNAYADHDKQGASFLPPLKDETGRLIESQKVYVGGLDPSIREDHLYALFSPFGNLQKVQLQCHPNTQLSRGYAFLTFYDPKVSNLAIRTMAGKIVTGRPLKTGWANQNQQSTASLASGCVVVTSDQYPDNASELAQKALAVLAQMTGAGAAAAVQQQQQQQQQQVPNTSFPGVANTSASNPVSLATMAEQELDKAMGLATATPSSTQAIPTVADARANMAAAPAPSMGATVAEARASLAADVAARQLAAATSAAAVAAAAESRQKSAFIGNGDPTRHLLVHNMYDKDEETDPGWEVDIKEEFLDECSKFGKIEHAKVMHLEPGGKIFATFESLQGAKTCAENLAGRWFDKRQLFVDYMPEATPP